MKKTLLFLLSLLMILMFSCSEENTLKDNKTPKITGISPDVTYKFDTVSINGIALNNYKDSLSLIINDNDFSSAVISESSTEVLFVITEDMESGNISLEVDGQETNSVEITIEATPYYEYEDVPAGTFMMGSEAGFFDEKPKHEVELTRDLHVFKYEVSEELWHFVMDSTALDNKNLLPKDNITWLNAVRFCNRLSAIEGLDTVYTIDGTNVSFDTEANGWRLPTEAEWEYFCRAGSQEDFAGSGEIDDMGWYDNNSGLNKHLSGMKLPNDFGLYDTHGNLWEWCWDRYSEDYYSNSPVVNPKGPDSGAERVYRGGSYLSGFNYTRTSTRKDKNFKASTIGLRIVKNAE